MHQRTSLWGALLLTAMGLGCVEVYAIPEPAPLAHGGQSPATALDAADASTEASADPATSPTPPAIER